MSWMPVDLLPGEHSTFGGQYVEMQDLTLLHNGQHKVTITHGLNSTLELDVDHDHDLIRHIAEGLLKVLGDAHRARVSLADQIKAAAA